MFTCTSVRASERAECVRMRRNRVRRSRRPRRMQTRDADSTRIHHAGMKPLTFGAAVTERWSGRGSGVRHASDRRQLQDYVLVRRTSRFSGGTFIAVSDGVPADWRRPKARRGFLLRFQRSQRLIRTGLLVVPRPPASHQLLVDVGVTHGNRASSGCQHSALCDASLCLMPCAAGC